MLFSCCLLLHFMVYFYIYITPKIYIHVIIASFTALSFSRKCFDILICTFFVTNVLFAIMDYHSKLVK